MCEILNMLMLTKFRVRKTTVIIKYGELVIKLHYTTEWDLNYFLEVIKYLEAET